MNKEDYQKLMDSMHTPEDMKNNIYKLISQPKKTYYKPITIVFVAACLVLAFIGYQSIITPTNMPFLIEVQAKEEVKQLTSDKPMQIEMKNTITNPDTNESGFSITSQGNNGQVIQSLLLTLPIQIKGEDVDTVTYNVNLDNAYLVPRYSLEALIIGDDEQTISAINEHVIIDHQEKTEFNQYKCFSEMSVAGQTIFKGYVDMYKDDLLKDVWWQELGKTEADLYKDEYTRILIMKIRNLSYRYYENDETFLRQLRLNEYRYFNWGKKEKTKQHTFTYDEQNNQWGIVQLLIQSSNNEDSIDKLIEHLKETKIEMTVHYKNGKVERKTLTFENINNITGEYNLNIQ